MSAQLPMTSIPAQIDPAVIARLEQMATPELRDGPMVQRLRCEAADLAQQMRQRERERAQGTADPHP